MIILLVITGIFAGILSGLLGIGGGIVLVPVLAYLYEGYSGLSPDQIMHLAVGTSLAAMIFTTLGGVLSHIRYKHYTGLTINIYWGLIPGLWVGAWGGNFLNSLISSRMLKIAFMMIAIIVAFRMIYFPHLFFQETKTHFTTPVFGAMGLVVGGISSLIGIGGGVFLVPILAYLGLKPYEVSAATSIGTLCSVCMGTIGSMYFGWGRIEGLELAIGYVYWPWALLLGIAGLIVAPFGVWLSKRLPVGHIRKIFAFLLVMIALRMGFNL